MVPRRPLSVRIALIHNHDPVRLVSASSAVRHLESALDVAGIAHESLWVSDQQWVVRCNQSFPKLVRRKVVVASETLRQMKDQETSNVWRLHFCGRLLGSVLRIIVSPRVRATERSRWTAEVALSKKHIDAWKQFLESSQSHLIILEDDVIERVSVELTARAIANVLRDERSDGACLVGALPWSEIGLPLAHRVSGIGWGLSVPVSNGTVGYLWSRDLVSFALGVVRQTRVENCDQPPADWLLNIIYRNRIATCNSTASAHRFYLMDPELFLHGSATDGVFESEIQR